MVLLIEAYKNDIFYFFHISRSKNAETYRVIVHYSNWQISQFEINNDYCIMYNE
jgi:hypothetical protein